MSAQTNLKTDSGNDQACRFAELETPVGLVRVFAAAGVIRRVDMQSQERFHDIPADGHRPEDPLLRRALDQLREYFAGTRLSFDLPMEPAGGTAFQRRAWQALCAIPFGQTRSYGDQARAIGAPAAVRAVGAANGRNPLGIIVPCHRVIGSDGKLTGYGGGLPAKQWLLGHEAKVLTAVTGQAPPAPAGRARSDQVELFRDAAP
jgi:methylated-DNA-[protein]-cysteine S-methyltransferase